MSAPRRISYIDVSDRALLALDGKDGLDLLQRISTNDLAKLKIGEHIQTIVTNEKGKIVDLVVVFRRSDTTLVLSGRSKGSEQLEKWIERYIVMEDVRLRQLANEWKQYLIFDLQGMDITASLNGYKGFFANIKSGETNQVLCIVDEKRAQDFELNLENLGCSRSSTIGYERYRILHRIPDSPNELCDRHNPLEVGLKDDVSFTKGCYVGQEVIARLDTYDKVRRELRLVELSEEPSSLPSELSGSEGERKGTITSFVHVTDSTQKIFGLALLDGRSITNDLHFSANGDVIGGRATVIAEDQSS